MERLDERHGPVVAAIEGLAYQQNETKLGKGDLLLIYSDGVTEAMNPALELYEERRLEDKEGEVGNESLLVAADMYS